MKLSYLIGAALLAACAPLAAQPAMSVEVPAPAETTAIPLGTGGVPGMPPESWTGGDSLRVRNVSRATLTPVLPAPGKETGAAVIVAPGGAFALLAIEKEGWRVARWLADHGIAAFVLKYRLKPTPADPAEAMQQRSAMSRPGRPLDLSVPPQSQQDGVAALRLVRARAAEWRVDPKRIGMMGFSAGAMTTLAVALNSTSVEMPAFIAPIYGPMITVKVPAGAPPMFAAIAADDPLFGGMGTGLVDSWRAAGKPVELHLYQKGGHGFGLGVPGTTTVGWLDNFRRWLAVNEFLSGRKSAVVSRR